jgi:hypothetical protein
MAKKGTIKKSKWIRDEALEMRGAIGFYRMLAKDAYERKDFSELRSQAGGLLSILGEKDIPPGDLIVNSHVMKDFIHCLKSLEEGNLNEEDFEENYHGSIHGSYRISKKLAYFGKNLK